MVLVVPPGGEGTAHVSDGHPLDNPVRAALLGPHAHLAERHGQVLRYQPDVSPLHAAALQLHAEAWDDLAALAGDGACR